MSEFFAAALSFPTVVFTVAMLVVAAYWVMVILGALGVDVLEFDVDASHGAGEGAMEGAMEGATEGAVEGATEGAVEGAVEGGVHGATEGAAEAGVEGAADGASHGLLGALLAAIRVKGVPITIVLSFLVFYAWIIAHLSTLYLLMGSSFDSGLTRGLLFVAAGVASFPLAALTARPLGSLVKEEVPVTRGDLVGKVVRVDTSRVDAKFGAATLDDGSGGLNLQIRCDADDNAMSRGSKALIMAWDASREAFEVTPFDNLLAKRTPE